jgi:glyoxylase-like metal-dependent hydrolase (beta-lactamase superfamily II)
VLGPTDGVVAFYDGRVDGHRFSEERNWVDEGALAVGIASYAIYDGDEALVYDTHVSVEHAGLVRSTLEGFGVRRFTVVLSHWHLDHVAGTAAFGGAEVIASRRTAELLAKHRPAIEAGEEDGPPPIDPLVLPTRTFAEQEHLDVGRIHVELIHADIHSDDATVLWLPDRRLLLAGDTMEDTVTYVVEPEGFDRHLADLERLERLEPERILPNHGDPGVIAEGGYSRGLNRATQQYVRVLQRLPDDPGLREAPLRELIAGPLAAGWVNYYDGYEAVHRENVETVLAAS